MKLISRNQCLRFAKQLLCDPKAGHVESGNNFNTSGSRNIAEIVYTLKWMSFTDKL